jgi:putative two-component system response regulator
MSIVAQLSEVSSPDALTAVAAPPARSAAPHDVCSGRIMIVDDEPANILAVRKRLREAGYRDFVTTGEPAQFRDLIVQQAPDVVLLDIVMPPPDGLELLAWMQRTPSLVHIPVIILTASDEPSTKARALELGAVDLLTKPVDPVELVPRVRNALVIKAHHDHLQNYALEMERQVRQRTEELAAARLELIRCLGRAGEYRDNDTGRHVMRVGRYAAIIARELDMEPAFVELLELAAPLHDLGKVGIPDAVLLKPGKLDPQEFALMQQHCGLGREALEPLSVEECSSLRTHTHLGLKILEAARSPVLELASRIAMTHHEKWDGSGYPLGLAGTDIPVEGRITAVADVFDALSSKRSYKPALPLDRCFTILEEERGKHFDPRVLDAFLARRPEVVAVRIDLAERD